MTTQYGSSPWWDTALTWICDKFTGALFWACRVDDALADFGTED